MIAFDTDVLTAILLVWCVINLLTLIVILSEAKNLAFSNT
jgi:hypothetical protein